MHTPVTVNLNVEVDASGNIEVFGSPADSYANEVVAIHTLPVNALYDETLNILNGMTKGAGLIEFWEPASDLGNIYAKLADGADFNINDNTSYKETAKVLASGLQRVLVDKLDAKNASPFSDSKYNGSNSTNYRECSDFGRLALSVYSHYLFGHVAATAAITNDEAFMTSMLSLTSDSTSVKSGGLPADRYSAWTKKTIVDTSDVDSWIGSQSVTDANLAIAIVKKILSKAAVPLSAIKTSQASNASGATVGSNTIANIVKQVIGQDASRAMGQDNNELTPDQHQILRFYENDVIYISITLNAPIVSVSSGINAGINNLNTYPSQKEKYDIKITLGPRNNEYDVIQTRNWIQQGQDIDGEASNDLSGYSVSLSSNGTTVAIGAPFNINDTNSGHVRVYKYNGTQWIQQGQDIDGEASNDRSGYSVSLSSDGTIIAIGAPFNIDTDISIGHVRVYKYIGTQWIQQGQDIDGEEFDDRSGYSVSLSSDGTTVAIGTPFSINGSSSSHVRVYKYISNVWIQQGQDINGEASGDQSGYSVSLSSNGTTVAIGAPFNINDTNSGHVRVYKYIGTQWIQQGQDINGEASSDRSGYLVSLSSDGTIIAIGAPYNNGSGIFSGHVRVYEYSGTQWIQQGQDINGEASDDQSGISVSLSSDGTTVAIGAPYNNGSSIDSGHVRVYKYIGNQWIQQGQDINGEASVDRSGYSVSLSSDGTTVVIGAILNDGNNGNNINSGHVRVYKYT